MIRKENFSLRQRHLTFLSLEERSRGCYLYPNHISKQKEARLEGLNQEGSLQA
jgi:hypothetical protein